jgi:hypothetical protein
VYSYLYVAMDVISISAYLWQVQTFSLTDVYDGIQNLVVVKQVFAEILG